MTFSKFNIASVPEVGPNNSLQIISGTSLLSIETGVEMGSICKFNSKLIKFLQQNKLRIIFRCSELYEFEIELQMCL